METERYPNLRLSDLRVIYFYLEMRSFEGSRYEFQVMVESLKTAREYEGKLKTIFSEGIPVKDTDKFQELRGGVLRG